MRHESCTKLPMVRAGLFVHTTWHRIRKAHIHVEREHPHITTVL